MADRWVKIMKRANYLALSAIAAFGMAACGNSDVEEVAAEAETTLAKDAPELTFKAQPDFDGTVAKPGSPFSVSYKVVGTPIVGSPVTVDLRVTSALGSEPVTITYRITDETAMMFHEAQPSSVKMAPAANEKFIAQQVTVIPQREGRVYLNVGASVETADGSMSSVIAIPIQVGKGGRILEENGEVQVDENGEAIKVLETE